MTTEGGDMDHTTWATSPWQLHDGRVIDLLTPEQFAAVPDGTVLVDIEGNDAVKGIDQIDDDLRFGKLAYGLERPAEYGRRVRARGRLTGKQADDVEREIRALEADPTTTLRQLRLLMQSPMPCGHAAGNLLTCDAPPFGCVICNSDSHDRELVEYAACGDCQTRGRCAEPNVLPCVNCRARAYLAFRASSDV